MKLTMGLAWANLLSIVVAFNVRGAAERALFYEVYIMEELAYADTAAMTIATGCVGTRIGLRGQPRRCALNEFMDYLWYPEDGPDAPSKPSFNDVIWGAAEDGDLTKAQATKMFSWIQQVKNQKIPGAGKTTKLPGAGYTGYLDTRKLFPTAEDYYDGLAKAGESGWNAIQAYNNDKSITEDFRSTWNFWASMIEDGAALVINYRVSDAAKFLCDQVRNKLQYKYGIKKADVVREPVTLIGGPKARISYGAQMVLDATLQNWALLTGENEDVIRNLIQTKELELTTDAAGIAHGKAMKSAYKAYNMVRTGTC